jgi:hypothetical protein
MARTDPTAPPVTVLCELGRHQRCAGTIVSLTSAHGAACACRCHREQPDPAGREAA